MPKYLKNLLIYTALFSVGAALFCYQLKDYEYEKIKGALLQADFTWIFASIAIATAAHFSRAKRWNLLLETFGEKPPVAKTFLAVMSGYFANLLAPRAGEVARCVMLNRMERVHLDTGIGSVVAERVFDFLCLLVLIGLALMAAFEPISNFLTIIITEKLKALESHLQLLYMLLGVMGALLIVASIFIWRKRKELAQKPLVQKLITFLLHLKDGAISIVKLQKRGQFLAHTIFIWTCYYLMTYLVFFSLPATFGLTPAAGLVILVVGGLAMSAPVQGGTGVFQAFVASALAIYGVAEFDGKIYSLLVWGTQLIFTVVVGGTCFITAVFLTKKDQA